MPMLARQSLKNQVRDETHSSASSYHISRELSVLYGAQLAVLSMHAVIKEEQGPFRLRQHPTAIDPVKMQVYLVFVHTKGLSRLVC